jgi:ATP-dependent DNA helicase RecQ
MATITDEKIYRELNEKFGFSEFKPGQLEILHKLLDQQDTLAILPTGAGKTLIYQMYGFLNEGAVVVISPLLSLIKDQINRLRLSGETRVAEITSQVFMVDQRQILGNLQRYKFIFMSPESLQRADVQAALQQIKIGLFVVDEAHCVIQWGKSFRPDYLRIGTVRQNLGNPLTLMLTATAGQQTRTGILEYLKVDPANYFEYISSVDRENIFLDFLKVNHQSDKEEQLLDLLDTLPGAGIIYFSSRKVANQVSELINRNLSVRSAPYHAGMTSYERFQIQDQFQRDQLNVICATSAFGMGIDKANIRFVIHYHMPGNIESYVQEIGRAGRDGRSSVAIMLYTPGDEVIPSILNDASVPSPEELKLYLNNGSLNEEQTELIKYYQEYGISDQELAQLFRKQQIQNEQQIFRMLKLVRAENCHRSLLLQYFDEKFENHDERCCGTTIDFSNLALKSSETESSIKKVELESWKKRLNRIFDEN